MTPEELNKKIKEYQKVNLRLRDDLKGDDLIAKI